MRLYARDLEVWIGGVKVLSGVSLDVSEGEVVGLIGRNGAGKTTTLHTLMGLVRPRSGKVYLERDGVELEVTGSKPYRIAGMGVSLVPQGRYIFPDLTVMENLEVAYGGRVPEGLLNEVFQYFPELGRIRDRLGIHLSGGEQQMLAIARALVRRPRIILMDEPLEGLAPKIVASLREVIKRLRGEGIGILMTEAGNIKRVRDLVDRVYGIDRGEIVFSGGIEDMLRDEAVRRRIWGV